MENLLQILVLCESIKSFPQSLLCGKLIYVQVKLENSNIIKNFQKIFAVENPTKFLNLKYQNESIREAQVIFHLPSHGKFLQYFLGFPI
jgi:hypothetical protein